MSNTTTATIAVVTAVLILAFIILKAKKRDAPKVTKPIQTRVPQLLRAPLADFMREAAIRGVAVDLSDITLILGETVDSGNVAESHGEVIIFNALYFKNKPYAHVLYIMFHELGHSLFGYRHSSDPQSIMAGGGVSAGGSLKLSETKRIDEFFKARVSS